MKNVITFLKKIKKNNNTPWMHAHKDEYLTAKKEFEFLAQELIARISSWDPKLPHLEPKDCTFRFNRDIRFSDNKKPYKENFGAYFAYGGKKGNLPGYYLNVSPTDNFIAAGLWQPEPDQLLKMRRFISDHGEDLKKIVNAKTFKKVFGELNSENVLKRPPKGFLPADPYIEFMKLKSFTASATLTLGDVLKPGLGKLVDKNFKLLKPLNDFLYEGMK